MQYVATERILQGAAATITGRFRDQHGELADPTGTVTATITTGDGTALLTDTATSNPSVGVYTVDLTPTQTASLDLLTATWSADGAAEWVMTRHAIVGGFIYSVTDLRTLDDVFHDTQKYPDWRLREVRRAVEDEFEQITGRSFVPRFDTIRTNLSRTTEQIWLRDPLRSVSFARLDNGEGSYTAVDVTDVRTLQGGIARRPVGWPTGDLLVGFEHGYDQPPEDIRAAAATRMRDVANRIYRGVPDRTSTFTSIDSGGTFTLIVPGQRGSLTGIPDVDVTLRRYRSPGLA